jgi:hypothetical protein
MNCASGLFCDRTRDIRLPVLAQHGNLIHICELSQLIPISKDKPLCSLRLELDNVPYLSSGVVLIFQTFDDILQVSFALEWTCFSLIDKVSQFFRFCGCLF